MKAKLIDHDNRLFDNKHVDHLNKRQRNEEYGEIKLRIRVTDETSNADGK